jgi:hypothetical protein
MTQIIAALTQEYVLLASDRRLTYGEGPKKGQIYDDDTCKLVSLCGTTGIAYSGVGEMKGRVPTHEWIAKTLAEAGCRDAQTAERTLFDRAPSGLSATPRELRRHIFLFAGWAHFEAPPVLRPYFAAITNFLDASGQRVLEPLDSFNASRHTCQQETHLCSVSGEALSKARADLLERNLRRLIDREIGPKEATRLLVEEVINTSKQCSTVGFKVLAFCIPKKGAEQFFSKGTAVMLAAEPNTETTSFSYFEDGYVELQQFGPTLTCSGFATTDIKTENDESQNRQSSQVRILALPKSVAQSAPRTGPIFKSRRMARSIIAFEFGISVDSAVVPGAFYKIPAAIRNTGDVPIVFAKGLSDDVGQEVPPSVQGGAVPAITLGWATGEWSIVNFEAVSSSTTPERHALPAGDRELTLLLFRQSFSAGLGVVFVHNFACLQETVVSGVLEWLWIARRTCKASGHSTCTPKPKSVEAGRVNHSNRTHTFGPLPSPGPGRCRGVGFNPPRLCSRHKQLQQNRCAPIARI